MFLKGIKKPKVVYTLSLNGIYEKMLRDKVPQETIERFAKISPIAWAHISFTGKYNFRKSNGRIDFDEIISVM